MTILLMASASNTLKYGQRRNLDPITGSLATFVSPRKVVQMYFKKISG